MRIAIGSDHRGVHLKGKLVELLQQMGHEVEDVGAHGSESVDYPDYAAAVGFRVAQGHVDRGILVCGTGIGMCIAANKIDGVRAATCHDVISAEICRRHNDVNVLCLSGDLTGERSLDNLIEKWLTTEFEGGRHERRLNKIRQIEEGKFQPPV